MILKPTSVAGHRMDTVHTFVLAWGCKPPKWACSTHSKPSWAWNRSPTVPC